MRSKITLLLALTLLFAITITAQEIGCCCDPITSQGSYATQTDCTTKGHTYTGPPQNATTTCSQQCAIPTCGDQTCQTTETPTNCPIDCATIPTGCGPTYKEPPQTTITPITAQKAIKITTQPNCPTEYLRIERCKENCTTYQTITETQQKTYIDDDPTLEFNKEYTYKITANYKTAGESQLTIQKTNLGDIECWNENTTFCTNTYTYNKYYDYLTTNGYGHYTGEEFQANFEAAVQYTFATRLNKAWKCDAQNKIENTPILQCTQNQYCIADEKGPTCKQPSTCNTYNPFGLYATQTNCETAKYCFFDQGKTTNACYNCNPNMTCYDYKTQTGCETDNCAAGNCQWNPTNPALAIGVCIDKDKSNCKNCDKNGTQGLQNQNITNQIWNSCTEEKANALSTPENPCFYNKDQQKIQTCQETTCADYTQFQCGTPTNGIKLNYDNSITQKSTDPCGIGSCEYNPTVGCVKNADGNTGAGYQDCKQGNRTCEQDYFTPTTTLIPTGQAGKTDYLQIKIFDKTNTTTAPTDKAGTTGYKTYLCIQNTTNTCTDASQYNIITDTNQLIIKNTLVKQSNTTLTKLQSGNNTIAYYSKDPSNNPETTKTTQIYICENCNGPTLLTLDVTAGKTIGKNIYTASTKPILTYTFDEPTTIKQAQLTTPTQQIQLAQITSGTATTHKFIPTQEINGTYQLTINGHNKQNVYFDSPGLVHQLTVDTQPTTIQISPDDLIINKTIIDVTINLSKPGTLTNVKLQLDDFNSPYTKQQTEEDITTKFTTTDNTTYTTKLEKLTGGKYTLQVHAKTYNQLDTYKQTTFYIATKDPQIRLNTPTYGTTAYTTTNITIETPIPSKCTYIFDLPTQPSPEQYQEYTAMTGLGTTHTAQVQLPLGTKKEHPLYVYCNFENYGTKTRTFQITLDPEPATITSAYAEPQTIAEPISGQNAYTTTLKVQLNKEGNCKYSPTTSNYDKMEGTFPETQPKQTLSTQVNVTAIKTYQYYVSCTGKNQLTTTPKQITFTVNLAEKLQATTNTPTILNTTEITLEITTNKKAICHIGEREDDITQCIDTCSPSTTHQQKITKEQGYYTYYATCTNTAGEQTKLQIPITIDTTPPEIEYANDDSSLTNPEITWSQNKIKLNIKAFDEESDISHYLITLKDDAGNTIFENLINNQTNGQPIYITETTTGPLRLTNNQKYIFTITAVNKAGLQTTTQTNGVTVDITQTPSPCKDGEQNQDETDTDCGGQCDPCTENKKCTTNTDCETNNCQQGKCTKTSCEDNQTNGLETDTDCGANCKKCQIQQNCKQNTDCETNYCDENKKCSNPLPCQDNTLTQGETDTDCGGQCKPCQEGQNCQQHTDCTTNYCSIEHKCGTIEELEQQIIPETPTKKTPIIITLIILALIGYGAYVVLQQKQTLPTRPQIKQQTKTEPTKELNLNDLKTFAAEHETGWIDYPITKHKTDNEALNKLKKIATKQKIKGIQKVLEDLNEEEKQDLIAKYKTMKTGLLTKEEREQLMKKLKEMAK